jgi:hypothetical protein
MELDTTNVYNASQFSETCDLLTQLGFIPFMESQILEILYTDIQTRIHRVCAGCLDELFLEQYFLWLDSFVVEWLGFITFDSLKIQCWMDKMRFHIYSVIYRLRYE